VNTMPTGTIHAPAISMAEIVEAPQMATDDSSEPAPKEGNLVAVLVLFAAWRPCNGCGAITLYIDEQMKTASQFVCGLCEQQRVALGRDCRSRKRRPMNSTWARKAA
jgi:hypothetical protein